MLGNASDVAKDSQGCALEIPGESISKQRECVRLIPPVARTDDFGCPTRRSEEATDGNLREAFCTFPGFCISLFRSHRHPGVHAPAHPPRTHRAFFPRPAWSICDYTACSGEATSGVSRMGRGLRPQP